MIVVLDDAAGIAIRRVRWRDRIVARVRTADLDRRLAAGASPEASVPLAVHAGRLCEPTERQVLARSLTRIAAAADAPMARRLAAPVDRPAVQRARAELAAVVGRLIASGPVDVQGVARARILVADGTGPLYRSAPPERLHRELTEVLAALDSFD
jgi:hypothetical protein